MKEIKIAAEVFSRVSGYFRPVYTNGKTGHWNKGKTEEFSQRKMLKVPNFDEYRASTRDFNTRSI